MRDSANRNPNQITCTVLRQAGYVPGPWLISDRYDTLSLICLNGGPRPEDLNEQPSDDLPFLMLIRDQHRNQNAAMYARPITPGHFAFSGSWLWSNDERFPADHPIPIHDSPQPSEPDEHPTSH
jgi:hypothetical protein